MTQFHCCINVMHGIHGCLLLYLVVLAPYGGFGESETLCYSQCGCLHPPAQSLRNLYTLLKLAPCLQYTLHIISTGLCVFRFNNAYSTFLCVQSFFFLSNFYGFNLIHLFFHDIWNWGHNEKGFPHRKTH